jgi:hypothetical protein
MRDPRLYGVAPDRTNEPIIWAVDNAWFESYDENNLSLDNLLRRDLKRGLSTAKTLVELKEVIEAGMMKGHSGDLEYLGVLVDICIQNDLQLGLCDFDCFRSRFLLLNQLGSAILLDVHCPGGHTSDYPQDEYGVYLLHEVLDGARPQADIFLVTGYESLARKVIASKRYETKWWPLNGIQIVDKSDARLRDSLGAFATYFVQGLQRDPFVKLSRGLIKARTKGNTHPMSTTNTSETIKSLLDSIKDLPLGDSFVRLEKEKPTQGLTSFKTLYHSRGYNAANAENEEGIRPSIGSESPKDSGFPRGEDKINTEILAEHFGFLGVDLKVETGLDLYLPIQPGLVFVLYFCAFIKWLEEKPTVHLELVKNQDGGRCRLFVPLKSTDGLRAAVYASETLGNATLWFKRMLNGSGEGIFELAKESIRNQRIPWKCPQRIGKGRAYPLIVKHAFVDNGVEFEWEWPDNG